MDAALAQAALDTIEKLKAENAELRSELTKARGGDDSTSILRKSEARALEPGLDSPGVLPGTAELRKALFTGDVKGRVEKDRKATS
jgi:hypothetical protein